MNKKIGITLDFVIRDYLTKLKEIYINEFELESVEVNSLINLYESFPLPKIQTTESSVAGEEELFEIIEIIDDTQDSLVVDKNVFNQFIEDYTIQIFGHCKEVVSNAMLHVNNLTKQLKVLDHEVVLLCEDTGKARPSTLFFLSKTSCEINTILFLKPGDEQLGYFDIIITADEKFAKGVYKNIKIKTQYNDEFLCEETYDSVKDINLIQILK